MSGASLHHADARVVTNPAATRAGLPARPLTDRFPRGATAVRSRRAPIGRPARLLRRALLTLALLTLLPISVNPCALAATLSQPATQAGSERVQTCAKDDSDCDAGGAGGRDGPVPSPGGDATQTPPPSCDDTLCQRIKAIYRDSRTQTVLIVLDQTPTGRQFLPYLLDMGARLGDDFISWHALSPMVVAGTTTDGGFIQLNSRLWSRWDFGPAFLAGALLHETVESYFEVADGLRQGGCMRTRHADYVAEWFNGKFARELRATPAYPYYHALAPAYLPGDYNAYGLSYDAWLNTTDDGQLYLGYPATCDLRTVDRKGRAWPPSDWWAEQGIWWFGQGTEIAPVPNGMRLSAAMLAADDLAQIAPA